MRRLKEPLSQGLADDSGTLVTVHHGEEVYSPIQYHSFRVGGHSVTLTVKPGETPLDTWRRGWEMLIEASNIEFEFQIKSYNQRLNRVRK